MVRNHTFHKIIPALVLISICLGLLLPSQTYAATQPGLVQKIWDGIYNLLTLRSVVGMIFSILSGLLNQVIDLTSFLSTPLQIQNIWAVFRNFVNMFFILALIIMAFGTIFDIEKYRARDLFVSFLIAAIFINFSFTIGVFILDFSNDLAGIFINTIRESLGGDIVGLFTQGFSVKKFFGPTTGNPIQGLGGIKYGYIADTLMSLIFLVVAVLAMIVVFFFLIIRIPFMWVLLIISPLAWMGLALPALRKFWHSWWEHFLGWCFWVPSYFFILMILAIILGTKGKAEVTWIQIFNHASTNSLARGGGEVLLQATGLNEIIYFLVTLIFMIGGIIMSFKVGKFFKGSVGIGFNAAIIATSRVRIPQRIGRWDIPRIGGMNLGQTFGAASQGVQGRLADILERGDSALDPRLRGGVLSSLVGEGDRVGRQRQAELAELIGGRKLAGAEHHELDKSVEDEMKSIIAAAEADPHNPLTPELSLNGLRGARNNIERLAWYKIRADRGWTDTQGTEIEDAWHLMHGMSSETGRQYWEKIKPLLDKPATDRLFAANSDPTTGLALPHHNLDWLALSKLRGEKGWFSSDPNAASNEIVAAIHELGGIQNENAKKYLESSKNNLNQATVNALYANPTLGSNGKLAIAEIRGERGWIPRGPAGKTEMIDTVRGMGENSDRAKKYLDGLDKNDFSNGFENAAEQKAFADEAGIPEQLKKKLYYNMARKLKLVVGENNEERVKAIQELLDLHEHDSKETLDQVKGFATQTFKNIAKSAKERRNLLNSDIWTGRSGAKKRLADLIVDNKEVIDRKTYDAIINTYNDPHNLKVLEMQAQVRSGPPTHLGADLAFQASRRTTADIAKLREDYQKAFARMSEKELAEISDEYLDETRTGYQEFLDGLVDDVQRREKHRTTKYVTDAGGHTNVYLGEGQEFIDRYERMAPSEHSDIVRFLRDKLPRPTTTPPTP